MVSDPIGRTADVLWNPGLAALPIELRPQRRRQDSNLQPAHYKWITEFLRPAEKGDGGCVMRSGITRVAVTPPE